MEERRRLYDERLVKEIMISTAICVQELMLDDPRAREDDVCEFVETNFRNIIQETLAAEMDRDTASESGASFPSGSESEDDSDACDEH